MTLARTIVVLLLLACTLAGQTAPVIVTTTVPDAFIGASYAFNLSATGGAPPYLWTITGFLPPGITVNASGAFTGTPTAYGSFPFTAKVTDARQSSATRSLTLIVLPAVKLTISTTSLSTGVVGSSYRQTLAAANGTPPYKWSVGQGFVPGLSLDPSTGVITGIPSAAGTYTFSIQVTDAVQATATSDLSIFIASPPLTITTLSPLFNGAVGVPYAQTFSAVGGKLPYTWSILSGNTGGLTLDPNSGTLQGTPQSAGSFGFTVQVTDSLGARASQAFLVVVNQTPLILTISGSLPAAMVGVSYNQKFPVSASGGNPPYTWSIASGSVPGLNFDATDVALVGTPGASGTFPLTLRVNDVNGLNTSRQFNLTVSAASLTITSDRQLPDANFNVPFSLQIAVLGGVPPFTWSASGLPTGLTIDPSSGVISGTPIAAGTFSFALTVADSTLNRSSDRFGINVKLPATPPITLAGLPNSIAAAQQLPLQLSLGSAFPTDITGQAILSFSPDSGPGDRTVVFASGGTTVNFTIVAGSTTPIFEQRDVPFAIQTGTVAGTLHVSVRLQAGVTDITPSPVPAMTGQIARTAPIIKSAQFTRSGSTLNVVIIGYSTAREITQIVFAFNAAGGQTLQPGASSITVPVESLFGSWYQDSTNAAYGSQFVFTQPFTIQGDASAVTPVSVTLTNRQGSVSMNVTQ